MGEMGMMGGGMMGSMMPGMMGGRGGGRMGEMEGMGGMGGMMGMGSMMPGMMGPGGMRGMGGPNAEAEKNIRKLTRTDFLLQFVWVPPVPSEEDKDKTPEELLEARKAELQEIVGKMIEAEKGNSAVTIPVSEAEIEKASTKKSDEIDSEITKALTAPAPGAPAAKGATPEAAPKS
jgi:type IV pilus assembly protein PilM